jgi:hypothetical protein
MELEEHVYQDDPSVGPADVKTSLEGVEYFFLGNGHIQGVVQWCNSGAGTPLGLLIMDPVTLGPKRAALTLDPETGLAHTMLCVEIEGERHRASAGHIDVHWTEVRGAPAVRAFWSSGALAVEELFYCPDRSRPVLVREARITPSIGSVTSLKVSTSKVESKVAAAKDKPAAVLLRYEIEKVDERLQVKVAHHDEAPECTGTAAYYARLANGSFSSELLDHLFATARNQLPAAIGAAGTMDGSIWQYNHEWVRDQAMVVAARVMLGEFEAGRTMLIRLLEEFVREDGGTIDSSCRRDDADIELDQNGELLIALKMYVDWTGDVSVLRAYWPKVRALAEFPLREVFRHEPSGLLHNQREYWERHAGYGIEDGMELANQLFVSLGLSCAAGLAEIVGRNEEGARWKAESERLKKAMIFDRRFGMVEDGHFIKRRKVNGEVQREIKIPEPDKLPAGIPLVEDGPHYLDPDVSSILPVAFEVVDPKGDLARSTLQEVERLWNQRWEGGGYGRYHTSSEPDAPGPWPFPTVFVARACFEACDDEKVWRILRWLGSVQGGKAGAWFEFYGLRPVPPCPQVGIIPWTWAEVLWLFIHHMLGVRPSYDGLQVRPRLLSGQDRMDVTLRVRAHSLRLAVRPAREGEEPGYHVDGTFHRFSEQGLRLPVPTKDLEVEVVTKA